MRQAASVRAESATEHISNLSSATCTRYASDLSRARRDSKRTETLPHPNPSVQTGNRTASVGVGEGYLWLIGWNIDDGED